MAPTIEQFSELVGKHPFDKLPNSKLVICPPATNSAAFFEYENNSAIGRFTYWTKGTAACEILGMGVGDANHTQHFEINSEAELCAALATFSDQILKFSEEG